MDNNGNNQQMNENQYTEQQNNQTNYNQQGYNQQQYNQQGYNQQQFNPQYQAPMYQPPIQDTTPLSVGQWMLTTLVLGLPCVGLIMGFVWGFGDGNVNRKNYARSFLIWEAIGLGLLIIYFVIIVGVIGLNLSDLSGSYYYYY